MTIKPMPATEESAHKRNASATSAVQTTPPPAKRPSIPSSSVTALPPARREFPHAVALVLYRDGADDVSSTTSVLGAYAGLADANAEVRRLAQDQGVKAGDEGAANDINPVRWDAPDGASCWVEMHAVKPKSFLPKTASGGSSPAEQQQPKKLYDADEGEDPDLDDDDQDEGGHYD